MGPRVTSNSVGEWYTPNRLAVIVKQEQYPALRNNVMEQQVAVILLSDLISYDKGSHGVYTRGVGTDSNRPVRVYMQHVQRWAETNTIEHYCFV